MLSRRQAIEIELELRRRKRVRDEARAKYFNDLSAFIKDAWHVLEPSNRYCHGWHIDAIAEHLMAVTDGKLKRLIVNVPPGMMKSLMVGVFWPAWEWGARDLPHYRYIGVAHMHELAKRDNIKMRRLIVSEWYKERFGDRVQLTKDQFSKIKFENTQTGFREAMASSSVTGSRADRILVDDPMSVADAESEKERENAYLFATEILPTRLNSPSESAIVVMMQRLHQKDTTGILLEKELGYEHLMLPMEFEVSRKCSTIIGFKDPRTEEGELLFPERFPRDTVDGLKETLGTYATAGQLQQRPAPRGGGIIKAHWLKLFQPANKPPKFDVLIQSYDTAFKTGKSNDFSVGMTIGLLKGDYYIIDRIKGRYEYPDLLRIVKEQYIKHSPQTILIEDKASGQSLLQSLRKETKFPILPVKIDKDKELRAHAVSALFENGRVYIINDNWTDDYIDVLTTFPKGAYDDDVDATTMALDHLYKISAKTIKTYAVDIFSR